MKTAYIDKKLRTEFLPEEYGRKNWFCEPHCKAKSTIGYIIDVCRVCKATKII